MNHKTIELQLLQLEESFSKSRSNIYSDTKKESHFTELYNLFAAIKTSEYKSFDLETLSNHKFLLDYIFTGLEYLDSSTLNVIPYEIISCLEYALEDWITKDHFIIVTSLSNRNGSFFLESNDTEETFNVINNYINRLYKTSLTHRLVKITLPKVLSRDYLSCVVLYHELGHFIDNELNVSRKLLFKKFFTNTPGTQEQENFYNHKMEFFADLFAAQYIQDASNLYLNHIAYKDPDSHTHPATDSRIQVVEDFINNRSCAIREEINEVLGLLKLPLIQKRYAVIKEADIALAKLIPQPLNEKAELHYMFKAGWELWNESDKNFLKDFHSRQRYHIINNLLEKSISNFTLLNQWDGISS